MNCQLSIGADCQTKWQGWSLDWTDLSSQSESLNQAVRNGSSGQTERPVADPFSWKNDGDEKVRG